MNQQIPEKGRRSFLRNTVMAATGALVLPSVLTSCTKEQLEEGTNKLPGGGLGSTPSQIYNLQATYYPNIQVVMTETDWIGRYRDFMRMGGQSRFRMLQGGNGFNYLQLEDDSWMTLSYAGWAYSSSEADRVGWKIIDGKMYCDYDRWRGYPLGCEERIDFFGFKYHYIGVDIGDSFVADRYLLRDCKFIPVQ